MEFECIEQYLAKYAQEAPDRAAVIVKDVRTSYDELWRLVRGVSRFLKEECGVKKGDCVVVKAMQNLNYAVSYFAVHLSGAIFVPLEKSITADKTMEIIDETEASVFIAKDAPEDFRGRHIPIKDIVTIGGQYDPDEYTYEFPCARDSADIMYTTGTTGKAKGVEVTHSVLLATAENYITGFQMPIGGGNVIAVPGPMNHVNPLRKLYTSIMSGNTIVILNGLISMNALFHALDTQGVNSLCLPPSFLRNIWQISGDKLAEYADQIDFVECSTAPVTESDKDILRRQLPKSRLYNNYGLSECGAMVMYDFNRYPDKAAGCVGKPMVNSDVIIVDDQRNEIASSIDHKGLIANKGSINMKGYWKSPELTAQVKKDGWVYTNDIGYFDEEGFLYVVGRKNDTINIGGLKVEPTEVEEAALLMEGVHECICVPVTDEMNGNALKLCVVMKKGCKFDRVKMIHHLQQHLLAYQIPKIYEEIDAVPRNFVGKPDRKAFLDGMETEKKKERILLVAGASSDVGMAYIKNYHKRYDKIVGTYHTHQEALTELKKELGEKLYLYRVNLLAEEEVDAFCHYLEDNGLLPNYFVYLPAAKTEMLRAHETALSMIRSDLELEVVAVMRLVKTIIPAMQSAQFGKLCFMLSSVIQHPVAFKSSYIISKYALLGLMKALAVEYAAKKITVNAISPSMIDTKYIEGISDFVMKKKLTMNPLKRLATVDDVIVAIDFLLDDKNEYMTGENLLLSGGNRERLSLSAA